MKVQLYILMSLLLIVSGNMYPDVIGSDTQVQALPHYVFPPVPGNRIAYFGWVQNGFTLQNSFTSVLFDSVFPVSGSIQLNGGTLNLNRNFMLDNFATLQGLGNINGNNHVFSLSSNISYLPVSSGTFQDIKIILNNDVTLDSAITLQGICIDCVLEGNGYRLILGDNASLNINGRVILHDVILEGIAGSNVQLVNNTSVLTLDHVTWVQDDNYNFSTGALAFENEVTFKGTSTFIYDSILTSTINTHATVIFDEHFTFSYDPSLPLLEPFGFVDETALLILNGGTLHAAGIGLLLTKGSLRVQANSIISSDNQIIIGDGILADDFKVDIGAGIMLKLQKGTLNYNNIDAISWIMGNSVSKLFMVTNTTLALYQTLNLGSGLAVFDNNSTLARVPTAVLQGSIVALGALNFVII